MSCKQIIYIIYIDNIDNIDFNSLGYGVIITDNWLLGMWLYIARQDQPGALTKFLHAVNWVDMEDRTAGCAWMIWMS